MRLHSAWSLKNTATRYSASFLACGIALVIRLLLGPVLDDNLPYITFFAAVAFSAWFCGVGPSIVAIVAAVLAARYWIILPTHSFTIPALAESLGALVFLFTSSIIVAFGETNRRNLERLARTQEELELQISQHTKELNTANKHLRDLTGHVLHLQDEERRRIARELHDGVGQSLAALGMNLSTIAADIERIAKTAATVADSATLVNDMSRDIRTISYLLHPPLLDEAGLLAALRLYIQGFAERSKIAVELDLSEDFGRLSGELEMAIFRVVQECLTNIHRHAGSLVAKITIARSANDIQVTVHDQGKGISPEKLSEMHTSSLPGVGIRGMRERIRQLGGTLEVSSDGDGKGTVVFARLPVANAASTVPTVSPARFLQMGA